MNEDLGDTTSIDVINDLVTLQGKFVLDVGCADMTFSRQLADHGARVMAIDPDPAQADSNRAAAATSEIDFVETGAERLTVEDGSVDAIFFSFSLHHVPASLYRQVFDEVRRALKPDGCLCVIEPADGPLNTVIKLFHDEDRVRAYAQDALIELAVPVFETHLVFRYHSYIQYESFDAFAREAAGRTFNSGYGEADVRRPEVIATFERLGAPDYRFVSPKVMVFLRGLKSA